jgi:hypothetical protein
MNGRKLVGIICLLVAGWIYAQSHGLLPVLPTPVIDSGVPEAPALSVLIIEDVDNRSQLSREQLELITGTRLKDWLQQQAPNRWRCWDQEQMTKVDWEDSWFLDALDLPRETLPWIIIANGKQGYSGPLPDNFEKTVSLIGGYE